MMRIDGGIVDAMRNNLAFLLVLEVVHVDVDGAALGPIVRAAVPEVADQLLLLRVDGDHRLAGRLRRLYLRVDVLELRVSSGWLDPSCVLRLTWREYASSSTSSLPTVFGLTSWPSATSSSADLLISDGCDWSGVIAKLFAKSMRPTTKAG